jgi:hypothetical protein
MMLYLQEHKTQGKTKWIFQRDSVQTIHSMDVAHNVLEEAPHGNDFQGILNRYFK